jgi:hypothetical protein
MKTENTAICSIVANALLSANINGAQIRDEVSAWVTLIGSIAITVTTIGVQIYHLIRDRNEDKNNRPADAENEDKENDKKNG